MAPETEIALRVLGAVSVEGHDDPLSPKQKVLVSALALAAGAVRVDTLADLLWPVDPPENPRAALQVHVSKLRRALDPAGGSIRRQGDGYALVIDPVRLDVARFERLAREGTAALLHDPGTARELLDSALSLWTGPTAEGLLEADWMQGELTRLSDVRLSVLHARLEADLALGHAHAAVAELRKLTAEHPLHEGFARQLMVAQCAAGRPGEALATYEVVRRNLATELGTDPSQELRALHQQILLGGSVAPTPPVEKPTTTEQSPQSAAVAVLPFQILTQSAEAAVVAAGLHSELLVELGRIPDLTVISRLSVLEYDGRTVSLAQVAADLGVDAVASGTLQISGERFRLAVELVDVTNGRHLWTESYEADLHPHTLLSVQSNLATQISRALSNTLNVTAPHHASPAATSSFAAFRFAAQARTDFDLKTETGLRDAVHGYRQALTADPDYLAGWLGLAEALAMTADYGYGDRSALLAAAGAALERATDQQPDLPESHVPRGLIAEGHFDAPAALAEYDAALRHFPGHADAHSWTAWVSLTIGAVPRALDHARATVRLNPLSAEAVSNLGLALISAGDPVAGLTYAERSEALSPGYTTGAYYRGLALYDAGRLDEAAEALHPLTLAAAGELAVPWAGQAPDAAYGIVLSRIGRDQEARDLLATIDPVAFPVEAGLVHLALGDEETATGSFYREVPSCYGSAMLYHLHFGELWEGLEPVCRADLGRRIAEAWNVDLSGPEGFPKGVGGKVT